MIDYNEIVGVEPPLMTCYDNYDADVLSDEPMMPMMPMMSSQNWGLMSGVDKVLGNRASCSRRRLIWSTVCLVNHQEADIETQIHKYKYTIIKLQQTKTNKSQSS